MTHDRPIQRHPDMARATSLAREPEAVACVACGKPFCPRNVSKELCYPCHLARQPQLAIEYALSARSANSKYKQ